MTAADIKKLIDIGLGVVQVAVQVGGDVAEIIETVKKIRAWAAGTVTPTQADFDALRASEAKYLAMLNDTTNDDPV